MKILPTSDWHIGQTLYNTNRIEEHGLVLLGVKEIAVSRSIDALIVSGDVFDTGVPGVGSQRLY